MKKKYSESINNDTIHVLQCTSKLCAGGVQSFLINYGENMNKEKVIFDYIVQTKEKCEFDEKVTNNGGKIHSVTPMDTSKIKYMIDVYNLLKAHPEYQIIHAHLNFQNIIPLLAAKFAGVKICISHSHSNYMATNFLKKIQRRIFQITLPVIASEYWACSKVAGEWLYGKKRSRNEEVDIVHNAIQVSEYMHSEQIRNKIRDKYNLNGKVVWIHIGMFGKAKNHNFLIELFQSYLQRNPEAILLLCGDGPERDHILAKIEKLKIADNVLILGIVNRVNEYLMAADVMVLPSLYEGLPMTCIEARATGCPVVVSYAVPKEAIWNKNAKICEKWNLKQWLDCIEDVIKINVDRKKLSCACIKQGYDISIEAEKMMEKYIDLYRS